MSLTVYDITDRELLWRLHDIADENGGATSQEIADALGLKSVEARHVSTRFAWLARYGALVGGEGERTNDKGNKVKARVWYLTLAGEAYVFSQLHARQRRSIEGLDDEVLLEVTSILTDRYDGLAPTAKSLMRRQFQSSMTRPRMTVSTGRRRNGK